MSQRKRGNPKGKTKDIDLFSVAVLTASDTFDKLKRRHKTYERASYVVKPKKDKRRRTEEEEDSSIPVSPYGTMLTEAIDTEEGAGSQVTMQSCWLHTLLRLRASKGSNLCEANSHRYRW